jgi:hypothetical protein
MRPNGINQYQGSVADLAKVMFHPLDCGSNLGKSFFNF